MGRSRVVSGRTPRSAATALVIALVIAAPSIAQQRSPDAAGARPLRRLLDRAATIEPGTYVVTDSALEPVPADLRLVVHPDVLRGANRAIRVILALGAEVPQASVVSLRLMTVAGSDHPARVIAERDASAQAGSVRLTHEFTLTAGEYDVHAAMGHPRTEGGIVAALTRFRLSVPDVWGDPLAITPIVVADTIGAAPRAPDGQPFTFGSTAIVPTTTARFSQESEINVAFRVYNWASDTGDPPDLKPDLTAEYVFYQEIAGRQRFFNKIKPQRLAADTLGDFNPAVGVVAGGMTVPLASFPFGDFQLRVRITDNRTKQSAERRVAFTVSP